MQDDVKKYIIIGGIVLLLATATGTAVLTNEQMIKESRKQFDIFIDYILRRWENRYTNDPDDPGGETRWGITKKDYPKLDIKNLRREVAIEIFWTDYWIRSKCYLLPLSIQFVHFGGVINFGVYGQTVVLQRAAGVRMDGVLGPITLAASQRVTPKQILDSQVIRYRGIIEDRPRSIKYWDGWMNRINDIYAKQLTFNQTGRITGIRKPKRPTK